MAFAAPVRSELFVEGNEFAGLNAFTRRFCEILKVDPVQEIGSADQPSRHYIVCQTMGVRLVLKIANESVFPHCNYCISVENEIAVEVSDDVVKNAVYAFVVVAAEAIAQKLTLADLRVIRI